MKNEKFEIIAKTLQGLEDILAQEIAELGGEDIEIGKRMVSFKGDKQLLYKTNLCCRTALRVLKPIFSFTASDTDEVYEKSSLSTGINICLPNKHSLSNLSFFRKNLNIRSSSPIVLKMPSPTFSWKKQVNARRSGSTMPISY